MKRSRKEQIGQLASELQRSTGREADIIKQLVDLLFEEAKAKLVNSEGDVTLRLQGEARALEALYRQLTVPSPTLNREQ